ncbi:hypothetical protein [Clostridium perfringens]|uniref:hypothetical protein n=1 Tax=Clostridium perfringens TaxID=1502 RepID=UPI0024BC04D3|nr:hypothetical protein [Clostridium perfringens]MDM0892548.1 hypothetical protein [Clostridium perfringens]
MLKNFSKEYTYVMPKKICNDKGIYEFITNLYNAFKYCSNSKITLISSSIRYIDPIMMSPLGLILTKFKSRKNFVCFNSLNKSIIKHLSLYGFLSPDYYNGYINQHTIKYNNFSSENFNEFKKYLKSSLKDLFDNDTLEKFLPYLWELFENVKMHSGNKKSKFKNKEIFTCGYYDTQKDYVTFSICNNGNTFKKNISSLRNIEFEREFEYITWSLKRSNSTRTKETPGGLGLSLICELVEKSKGSLTIISGKGFVQYDFNKNILINDDFGSSYPGNIITIHLPISKTKEYLDTIETPFLKKVISAKDLFMEDL